MDAPTRSQESEGPTLKERIASHVFDPALMVIAADEIKALTETLRRGLTKLEGDVLQLFLHGKSYEEIAAKVGAEIKHVDNALQRIRMKVRRHLHHRDEPLA